MKEQPEIAFAVVKGDLARSAAHYRDYYEIAPEKIAEILRQIADEIV